MRPLLAVIGLAGLACSASPTGVSLGRDFVLRPGQVASVTGTGLVLTFREVTEDSRCPSDAACVWAGNGAVRVDVATGDVGREPMILNTTLEPRAGLAGPYQVLLVSLAPEPTSGRPIAPQDYRARLRVSAQ